MRTRIVQVAGTTLLVVSASCHFPENGQPSCDDDIDLCPRSSTSATSVTCDCRCTIGASASSGSTYEGRYAVCLPAQLNVAAASDVQRVALQAVEPREYAQRVYQFCSRDVARFVRSTVKLHSLLRISACVQPVVCECSTTGTERESPFCRTPCNDRACDETNCPTVLRQGAALDMTMCSCTRSTACGLTTPQVEEPGLCRDLMTPTKTPSTPTPVAPAP